MNQSVILKIYLQNGLVRIVKIQNLSQNELDQIAKMKNLLQNELEKIAKIRHIKNYKNMSKEGLLIALLKSGQSLAELYKNKSNSVEIGETKKIFNELGNRFSKSNIKDIRKNLCEKEKGLENEEQEKKTTCQRIKKIINFLKRLQGKENLKKKYRNRDSQDYVEIKYIKNLYKKDYYKPVKIKSAFNDNYIEYKRRGDKIYQR